MHLSKNFLRKILESGTLENVTGGDRGSVLEHRLNAENRRILNKRIAGCIARKRPFVSGSILSC